MNYEQFKVHDWLCKNTLRSSNPWMLPALRFVDDANWHLTLILHLLGHMVLIVPQVCKWVKFHIFRLSYMAFDFMNMWRFLHYINKPCLIPIGLHFSNEGNVTFWALLRTIWPLPTFDLGIHDFRIARWAPYIFKNTRLPAHCVPKARQMDAKT